MTGGLSVSAYSGIANLCDGSFRDSFTFVTPLDFQESVASDPAPLPGGRWKYSVSRGEMNVAATPGSPNLEPLYLFGRKDGIKDLEMEDRFSSIPEPPLVTCAHRTVSVSVRVVDFHGRQRGTHNKCFLVRRSVRWRIT